jgi:tetratricopeptide (TPR) repeat protein
VSSRGTVPSRLAGYRRPPVGTQPDYLHPPYKSSVKRAPARGLVLLPHGLSEVTGPSFEAERLEIKSPEQARKEYTAALKDFQTAATAKPDNYRAHNGAGYALRKLGDYDRALQSYERALTLAPASTEAIEYRGEAYLGLNRLDDAKQAYMHLFVHDRGASNVLMKAMRAWVHNQQAKPGVVDPAIVAAFDAWVRERDTLASSVGNLGHNSPDWK